MGALTPAPAGLPAPLRILFYTGIDPSLSQGHAAHVRHLVDALVGRGHGVRCLCLPPMGPIAWAGPPDGLAIIERPALPRVGHWIGQWRARRTLRREVRAFEPDVVLSRMESMTLAPLGVPPRIPLCVESNASCAGHAEYRGRSWARRRIEEGVEGAILRRASVIGVAAPGLAEIHGKRYAIPPDRFVFVPNGSSLPELDLAAALTERRAHRLADDRFVIGFFGNLTRWQRLDLVLDALVDDRLASIHLWVAGDGTERSTLESAVQSRGLSARVSFLGACAEDQVARLAQASQVLVAPYDRAVMQTLVGDDTPTLKLLLAMACDRPVLTSGSEQVATLEAGEVIDATPAAWAGALARFSQRWHESARPLRDWPWPHGSGPGRAFIEAHRTWDQTAQAWEKAMTSVIAARSRRP